MNDIFAKRLARPMLIANQSEPFNSPEYLFELKFDGIRCLAYIDRKSVDLRNKRNKELINQFPELSNIFSNVNGQCILDGEIIVLKNGKPDFYEVQKRTVITDFFKIKLLSEKYPATFVVYDLIYLDNDLLIDIPIEERINKLPRLINEDNRISISKVIENTGIELFNIVKSKELEGVVAKRKGSKYFFEKRSTDWIKFKYLVDDDFVLCGYIQKDNNMTSFILGKYDSGNNLKYHGHVTLGAGIRTLNQYNYTIIKHHPFNCDLPKGNDNAVWIEPNLVCTVQYMPSNKEGMRQPVCKGIREDKEKKECRE